MARVPQRPSLPANGLLDPEVLLLEFLIGGVFKAALMIHNALFYY